MEVSGVIDFSAWLTITLTTLFVAIFALYKTNNGRLKLMLILMLASVYIYSGYGISYVEVSNRYVIHYIILIICLVLPFCFYKNKPVSYESDELSLLDEYILGHHVFIKRAAMLYLICMFIPLVYPNFKLFDIFKSGFSGLEGFYDLRVEYKSNALIGITDTLRIFVQPFFMAYLTILQLNEKKRKAVFLFCSTVLMAYMRYSYLGRYQMVIYALLIYLLCTSVKGFSVTIKMKQILLVAAAGFAAIPLLVMFTSIRVGNSYEGSVVFSEMLKMLIDTEAYYPIHYDHIVTSTYLDSQTPATFILWLIFLPLPSFIWPGKPTLQSDAFTYSISGMHYGDVGYSSSLPSFMGESLMFFGENAYWIQGIIVGFVMVYIISTLSKHKTMTFFSIYLVVFVLTLGRGGASSYMSTLINGSVAVFIMNFYVKQSYRK